MKLATLFQDGAVFQRDKYIKVWGETLPNVLVTGNFAGTETYSRSGTDGKFTIIFPPQAAGGPYQMRISVPDTDECVIVNDILVGIVWLASGQSNMQYELISDWRKEAVSPECTGKAQMEEFKSLIKNPDDFRYIKVPQIASSASESSFDGVWKKMTAQDCENASAVAAWFGYFLRQKLDCPVGLIISSWGGTIAEAWMSYSALASCPQTRSLPQAVWESHKQKDNYLSNKGKIDISRSKYIKRDPGNEGIKSGYADPGFDDSAWRGMNIPGSWIKQEVAGNGIIWARYTVELPAAWKGKQLLLHADGGIDKTDIAYFNGQEVGRTGEGLDITCYETPRCYPVPAELVTSRRAVVAFRAFSFCYDGFFGKGIYLEEPVSGEKLSIEGNWKVKAEHDFGIIDVKRDPSVFAPGVPNTPAILFESMIRPLIPYTIDGFLWYQGESNTKTPVHSREYYHILRAMIADWRYQWQDPELPFVMVQLAGFGLYQDYSATSTWARLRESQRLMAKDNGLTAMATAIDLGEELDIHPQNKKDVGKRLALRTLHDFYGFKDILPGGPEICSAKAAAAGEVILSFELADGLKLTADGKKAFYVSADNISYLPVDSAVVRQNTVILKCAACPEIKSVRYAWADFPPVAIYNKAFPASSFEITVD